MIRNIEMKDLDFLIKIDLEDEGITNSHNTYDVTKDKMIRFIQEDDFGGFIIDGIAVILFNVENKFRHYDWPTIYDELSNRYFDPSGDMLVVYQLWVHPDHRRKGYASLLKKAFEEEARRRRIQTLYTHTEVQNDHVIELNQKLDYKVVRVGPIWDDIKRVSMVKDLRTDTAWSMLRYAQDKTCLIDAETLKSRLELQDIQVLDIRLPEDVHEKSIPGSVICHWYDVHQLIAENRLHKQQDIVVVCYTGQSSMHVATLLNLLGFKAYSLLDGLEKY